MRLVLPLQNMMPLFMMNAGHQLKSRKLQEVSDEIKLLGEEQILNTDPEALVVHYVEKHAVDLLVLHFDNMTSERRSGTLTPPRSAKDANHRLRAAHPTP
jgi:hypothetical protein